jgi:putative hydrolase of the HAD superfamily
MTRIELIAFDADDTLWHNEFLYSETAQEFTQLLSAYAKPERILQTIDEIELQNLEYFGYGIKSFALSLIEAAIKVKNEEVIGNEIQVIITLIRKMLLAEVRFMDGVVDTSALLSTSYPLMLITKGDLFE